MRSDPIEETEHDDIEDQAYHFAENEATAYRADDMAAEAEDIYVDEDEAGVSNHLLWSSIRELALRGPPIDTAKPNVR